MRPRFQETTHKSSNSSSHCTEHSCFQQRIEGATDGKRQPQTGTVLLEEQWALTCQANKIDNLLNALNKKIRIAEEAYTTVKNKSIVANTCVSALPMNRKEIKLVKADLKVWLNNLGVMVKGKIKELLKAIPKEYWNKFK